MFLSYPSQNGKDQQNQKLEGGEGSGEGPPLLLVGLQTRAISLGINLENAHKVKEDLLHHPAIPLPGTLPKDWTSYTINACLAMSIAAPVTVARRRNKQPECLLIKCNHGTRTL